MASLCYNAEENGDGVSRVKAAVLVQGFGPLNGNNNSKYLFSDHSVWAPF